MLSLAFGFGLGVLAMVVAGEYERRRAFKRGPVFTGTERLTVFIGDYLSQDSTLPRNK